jgi:uncharacterized protein YjiS (DUF1127 family)
MATDILDLSRPAFYRTGLEHAMTSIKSIRTRLEQRKVYNRTVTELQRMPLDVALDLDIDRSDAHRIAAKAVYG